MEKYGTARQAADNNKIRRMRSACWMTKAYKHTLRTYSYCFFTVKMAMRMRLNVVFTRTLPVFSVI
jgi:hypothetical protein